MRPYKEDPTKYFWILFFFVMGIVLLIRTFEIDYKNHSVNKDNQIEVLIKETFKLYNLKPTNKNFFKALNTLNILKKEYGVEQIEILKEMLKMGKSELWPNFPTAAGIASTSIVIEKKNN